LPTLDVRHPSVNQIKRNLAGMVLAKRRFRFVNTKLILRRDGLLREFKLILKKNSLEPAKQILQ